MSRPEAVDPPSPARVREVLGHDPVGVTALTHSTRSGVTRGVWRVETPGRAAVVKRLSNGFADPGFRGSHDPTQPWYWRRELHFYEQGIPVPYRDAGVRAPERLGVTESAGDVLLWLEAAPGRNGAGLTVADLGRSAQRLGRAQGRYGVDHPLPDESWWCRQFVGRYLRTFDDGVDYGLLDDDRAWARPVIAEAVDPGLRHRVGRLLADQDELLHLLETRPRTVAHLDVWPANLFVPEGARSGDDELVLIDWAFCGLGAVGEDIGNLIVDSVLDLLLPAAALPEIEEVVLEGYRRGLEEVGWPGRTEDLLAALGGTAVKYLWLLPHMLGRAVRAEQVGYGGEVVEDQVALFWARSTGLRLLLDWADRARGLAR